MLESHQISPEPPSSRDTLKRSAMNFPHRTKSKKSPLHSRNPNPMQTFYGFSV